MVPTKKQRLLTISLFIGAIINFILNLVLIRYFKSIGAAIASIVAEGAITIVQLYMVRKEISFIKIFRESFKYLIGAIIMFIAISFIVVGLEPTVVNSLVMAAGGALIYVITLVICRDELLFEAKGMLLNTLEARKNIQK